MTAYSYAEVMASPTLRNEGSLTVNVPVPFQLFAPRVVLNWYADCVLAEGDDMDNPEIMASDPDIDGNCILRIPVNEHTMFYTLEHAVIAVVLASNTVLVQ